MDELIGTIKLFAGNYAPHYQALFSIIGTTYGENGVNTFALPDLRSRVPVGAGKVDGLSSFAAGQKAGVESNILQNTNIPTLQGNVDLSALKGTASGPVSTSVNATIPVPCGTSADSPSPVNNVLAGDSLSNVSNYSTVAESGKYMKPLTATLPIHFTASLPVSLDGGSVSVVVNHAKGMPQQPVSNIQPSLGLNYIICMEGVYPQRN
jgi:microcystin-dependent protein